MCGRLMADGLALVASVTALAAIDGTASPAGTTPDAAAATTTPVPEPTHEAAASATALSIEDMQVPPL